MHRGYIRVGAGLLLVMLAGITLAGPVDDIASLEKYLAAFAQPPAELAKDGSKLRSPLLRPDNTPITTPAEWAKRREEIRQEWHRALGPWPALLERPKLEYLEKERRENVTQHHVRIETAPGRTTEDAYLLMPEGKGPFPAVLVVYYEAKTGIGRGKSELRDFAWQLARRGYVTLSLGGDPNTYYPTKEKCRIQPLSFHAYEAANCCTLLGNLPEVDASRIGVVGHSYGGKWAMFASCLHDGFACAAWSDGGVVFDEKRSNVNFWEPWYLGFDPSLKAQRKAGIPSPTNPRTGPYKSLIEQGHDLHELHALMAPRPFLVSGGSEDQPERWKDLSHAVAVNRLLGKSNRVFMTNRKAHGPTEESNEQMYRFFDYFLKHGKARE